MSEHDIAEMFRKGELSRRDSRRQYLLKCLHSEAALEAEKLDNPEDVTAHLAAIKSLKRQSLAFEKAMKPRYWERLWAAIWGR